MSPNLELFVIATSVRDWSRWHEVARMFVEGTPAISGGADTLGLLEGVLENAPIALEVRAADGPSVLANRRFRDLFGLGPPVECDCPRSGTGEVPQRSR